VRRVVRRYFSHRHRIIYNNITRVVLIWCFSFIPLAFVANLVCLLFAYFVFPHEPRKRKHCDQSTETKQKCDVPSASFLLQTVFKSIQYLYYQTYYYDKLLRVLKYSANENNLKFYRNSDLVYVALSYACSNALSWPWSQMIDITYSKVGFPQVICTSPADNYKTARNKTITITIIL
jgi:hypothetical protein